MLLCIRHRLARKNVIIKELARRSWPHQHREEEEAADQSVHTLWQLEYTPNSCLYPSCLAPITAEAKKPRSDQKHTKAFTSIHKWRWSRRTSRAPLNCSIENNVFLRFASFYAHSSSSPTHSLFLQCCCVPSKAFNHLRLPFRKEDDAADLPFMSPPPASFITEFVNIFGSITVVLRYIKLG